MTISGIELVAGLPQDGVPVFFIDLQEAYDLKSFAVVQPLQSQSIEKCSAPSLNLYLRGT